MDGACPGVNSPNVNLVDMDSYAVDSKFEPENYIVSNMHYR